MSKTETKPSITAQIAELDAAVAWFESPDFSLDQALSRYQAATKLAANIEKQLSELKNQVEVIADFTK